MSILNEIQEQLQKGKAKLVAAQVEEALAAGVAPQEIMEALLSAMGVVGERFKKDEVFVPDVMIAARAMNQGAALLKPLLMEDGAQAKGKVCIGTVQGDLHDIGKNLVKMMLEGVGIECIDLGTDISAEQVVEAVKESGAEIVALSSLLTTTMEYHKDIVDALKEEGMKKSVLVCSTGDQPPLIRQKALLTATAVCEYFRDQGKKVFLMTDTITRCAMAGREVGLSIGEPPTMKGYPPSIFSWLQKVLERDKLKKLTKINLSKKLLKKLYQVLVLEVLQQANIQ